MVFPGKKRTSLLKGRKKEIFKINTRPRFIYFISFFLVAIMIGSSSSLLFHTGSGANHAAERTPAVITSEAGPNFLTGNYVVIPHSPVSVAGADGTPYNGTISLLVSFSLDNLTSLNILLSDIQNTSSTHYHRYITRTQFASDFSVSSRTYAEAALYFSSFSGLTVRKYSDRVSMEIRGPASIIGAAFNTSFSARHGMYHAVSNPKLPGGFGDKVSFVSGLSNSLVLHPTILNASISNGSAGYSSILSGYPNPDAHSGHQDVFGSDMQVAYDEQSLFNVSYASREVIANILWSGHNEGGRSVSAFYPPDISAYYNATMPFFEPRPHAHGVPIEGAVDPGISSSYDITGASLANTMGLEMAGSLAPGANLYDVYGPTPTYETVLSALAFVLNPNSSYSQLNNVSVISNTWVGPSYNSTVFSQYMKEAAARGITVVGSSGSSGGDPGSPANHGAAENLQSPASMAYDSFGVTAVGGTNVTLGSQLQILNQNAWYMNTTSGMIGSSGGVSANYPEPTWQNDSMANSVLNGAGRGVPDIAGIANNTVVFETVDGVSHDSMSSYYTGYGTGIAASLYAGMIAETNAILHHFHQNNAGYLNPFIYSIADKQFKPYPTPTFSHGFELSGHYNASAGMEAFSDVYRGGNFLFGARYGYNLVTGWGSVNAYNFTSYMLQTNYSKDPYALKGVIDNLSLSGMKVTSYRINYSDMKNGKVNTVLNASIQQNLFLSNQLNAPIYWVQNVIDFKGSQQAGWKIYYSEWVMLPYYGQYHHETFEYNYHLLGDFSHLPSKYDMKTWLAGSAHGDAQVMYFKFDSKPTLSIPVPGAAYIIAQHNYTYSWNGRTYYNGPYPDNPVPGGLDPQLGLVGGPTLSNGEFQSPTAGTMNVSYEPMYMNRYIPAKTTVFHNATDQTGERASNLLWSEASPGNWTLGIRQNSGIQGVEIYAPRAYNVTLGEVGLPNGTQWFANLSGGVSYSSDSGNITFMLPNGTYSVDMGTVGSYTSNPGKYTFRVQGNTVIAQKMNFTFVPRSLVPGISNHLLYAIVGSVLVLAIIGSAAWTRIKRKK